MLTVPFKTTIMRKLIIAFAMLLCGNVLFGQRSLTLLWETDTILQAPESVRYDDVRDVFYITNIGDFNKEGTGFISTMDADGKILKKDWITGLTAPKGMGLVGDLLYVGEHTTVAVIDVANGKLVKRIPIKGAVMLNDITVDDDGVVYVSDTRTDKVHRIESDKPEVYLTDVSSANGLLSDGSTLYILAGDKLIKANRNKKLTTLATGIEGGADGIEKVNAEEFIVTGWEGTVYIINANGDNRLLLDTRDDNANAADLWYDAESQTVYIPVMSKNKVVAYRLE